ncbi:purine nucleoside phosphorylase [Streptomyces sp. NBRC 110611]|uniref:hypothetical protein n=1 Tax=Streptomyces sp. NBRC 110611 TaxID=1621259 RepID=UPI0008574C9A|nr:hypothetical protein [Streptomyces sp. NBRC 110611]GAU67195.1 purine nucleoside phosphorylase [Streptomyces sp. NBRC 110611]
MGGVTRTDTDPRATRLLITDPHTHRVRHMVLELGRSIGWIVFDRTADYTYVVTSGPRTSR